MRTAFRWLGVLLVIALVALLVAIAFVFTQEKLGTIAALLVGVFLAVPAGRAIVWPMRRWKLGDFSPTLLRQAQRPPSGEMARALLWLVAAVLAAIIIFPLLFGGWALTIALGVLAFLMMLPLHAAWLLDYQRLDLRVLARWDAWLRPNRLRRQLRG